jgi:hypothetical protein
VSLGLGAGQHRWTILFRSIPVHNGGVARGLDQCRAANGVCSGTQSTLVIAMSHFPELKSELEVLRSRRNADLTGDQADALWTRVHVALDSLALHVPPTPARSPPDGAEE